MRHGCARRASSTTVSAVPEPRSVLGPQAEGAADAGPRGRALVAGGAGFIGSHLCRRLLAEGWRVCAVDNLSTGHEEQLADLRGHPRFELRVHDITEPLDLPADHIFNLACPASPVHYMADPWQTLRTCLQGSMNLLDLARRQGARLLLASTSEVYGDPEQHPQHERYWGHVNPIGPRACYDEGKRCAETLHMAHHRMHGTDIRIVRIFNTYGPGMSLDDGRVVSNFVVQALRGEPLRLHGDGLQTRSLCYVDDLVDGLLRMMAQNRSAGPVNLGNPVEYTMRALALHIVGMTGSASAIVHGPLPEDDPRRRRPDIGRAHALLGWQPRVALDEGLAQTVADFRARLEHSTPVGSTAAPGRASPLDRTDRTKAATPANRPNRANPALG